LRKTRPDLDFHPISRVIPTFSVVLPSRSSIATAFLKLRAGPFPQALQAVR
jgi:hypothetical protein